MTPQELALTAEIATLRERLAEAENYAGHFAEQAAEMGRLANEEGHRATAAERALAEHRERWQRLVNEIAGAFNNGMVVGDDAQSVEYAITLIRAALPSTALTAGAVLEAAEAWHASEKRYFAMMEEDPGDPDDEAMVEQAMNEAEHQLEAAVAAHIAAREGGR